jgi:hypothetical protein
VSLQEFVHLHHFVYFQCLIVFAWLGNPGHCLVFTGS